MTYVDHVYEVIMRESEGMDALYEDYICSLVGLYGLNVLIENRLVESCGVINGRRLYTLCVKK